jgi:cytochrome c-type biogenesis protein CcmF
LCATVIISAGILTTALMVSDFSLRYVWMYSNRTLEPIYKFTALWGGQEGSMLFWCLVLSIVSSIAIMMMRKKEATNSKCIAVMVATFATVLFFFHIVMYFAENPFAILNTPLADGRGLNPLLQTWSMIVHPPCLYMGFILCTVPFAIAVANLLTGGSSDNRLIRETRLWTIAAWFFLSIGNLLGANWAYNELGWGGFWAWDPVENAAIMPWFTTTAFLHSLMVQERRGMLKTWNFILVAISFCLTIMGTFITRSGLVTSVHSFARSNLGFFFLAFLVICISFCITLAIVYRRELKSEGTIDSLLSREAAFVINNILLTISAFAILWGTLFPIFSEIITGKKITVGPPFFNSFMVPIGLLILLLMGIAQSIAWRKTRVDRLLQLFLWPTLSGLLTALITMLIYRDFTLTGIFVTLSFGLSMFVLGSLIQEFWRGIQARHRSQGENYFAALINLVLAARRRYGGYIVHFGVLLIFLGITGIAFKIEREVELSPGESTQIGGYLITYRALQLTSDPHKEAATAVLDIQKGKTFFQLQPARFFYRGATDGNDKMGNSGEPQNSTEVSLHSNLLEDLYTVLHTFQLENRRATFMFVVNPLIIWLWIGGGVLIFGTLIILIPKRFNAITSKSALSHQTILQTIREIEFDHQIGKMPEADLKEMRRELIDKAAEIQTAVLNDLELLRSKTATENISTLSFSFCKNCAMPLPKEARFCTQCGKAQ